MPSAPQSSRPVPLDCCHCHGPCGPDADWSILIGYPPAAAWTGRTNPVYAAHTGCEDPDHAMYAINTPMGGIHTEATLLRWSAHLSEKTWLPTSQWGAFLRLALERAEARAPGGSGD